MRRFFLHAILAAAICLPVFAEETAKSILLVARKDLPDPFFGDSVVLVTNAAVAPMGVIINKPLDEKLYFGGPVQADEVLFIFRSKKPVENAVRLLEGVYISGSHEILDSLLARDNPVEGLRVFAGHAGWSPGQLESEIARGDWDLAPADAASIFTGKPENLWLELHRRAAATKVLYRAGP